MPRLPLGRSGNGDRRLVLVVGIGRSGTSVCTGLLAALGYAVPQPEVQADDTNPRGFGEPQWVVDLHSRLLRKVRVSNFDGRPSAWALTDAAAADGRKVERLRDWLDGQLQQHPRVVVKDPRTAWLLPLWREAAGGLGVTPAYVTMLRPRRRWCPAPAAGTATRGTRRAGSRDGSTSCCTPSWSRGGSLGPSSAMTGSSPGWRAELERLDDSLDLGLALDDVAATARANDLVDPTLRRERVGWSDLDLPQTLRTVAENAWSALLPLAESAGPADRPPAAARLDAARADYERLYADAELIAQWSIVAARGTAKRKGKGRRTGGRVAAAGGRGRPGH